MGIYRVRFCQTQEYNVIEGKMVEFDFEGVRMLKNLAFLPVHEGVEMMEKENGKVSGGMDWGKFS